MLRIVDMKLVDKYKLEILPPIFLLLGKNAKLGIVSYGAKLRKTLKQLCRSAYRRAY